MKDLRPPWRVHARVEAMMPGRSPVLRALRVPPAVLMGAVLLVALPAQARRTRRPPAPERVVQVLERIERKVRHTAYKPVLRVNERIGRYEFDCSAMAGWVLARSAPRARKAIGRKRPVARDFYRIIRRSPTTRARRGWRKLAHIGQAQPGDVLAWKRPPWFRSRNTGHVAFVIEPPRPAGNGFLIRIVDATSLPHGQDTRSGNATGFGRGTLYVPVDPATGQGTAYGWFGQRSLDKNWLIETPVVIGRVSR